VGRQPRVRNLLLGIAIATLLVCGNSFVAESLTRALESQYPPIAGSVTADLIVVLSGGVNPRVPPRETVEVSEAADRVIYGAHLFRTNRARLVITTGNVVPPETSQRSTADEMAELLNVLGVPLNAILPERRARDTHEHAVYVCPMVRAEHAQSVLLVTSAMHMSRSLGVFRHACPDLTFIPAPTDYRVTNQARRPWYRDPIRFLPTPLTLSNFSDAAHEYLGLAYYRMRGWL
jgi:uncharacterized SAM-binding protein YcdF (DUF218 family)